MEICVILSDPSFNLQSEIKALQFKAIFTQNRPELKVCLHAYLSVSLFYFWRLV